MQGKASGPATQVKTVITPASGPGSARSTPMSGPPAPTALSASASAQRPAVTSVVRTKRRTSAAPMNMTIWKIIPRWSRHQSPRIALALRQTGRRESVTARVAPSRDVTTSRSPRRPRRYALRQRATCSSGAAISSWERSTFAAPGVPTAVTSSPARTPASAAGLPARTSRTIVAPIGWSSNESGRAKDCVCSSDSAGESRVAGEAKPVSGRPEVRPRKSDL